jgi:hypothetical protein
MKNRQKVSSDSSCFDYRVGMDTCLLSSDYDMMLVKGRGVKGYLNDIIDFTRDKINDLAYVSSIGETKVLSGKGSYVIDGVRKKHDGIYASVYYDPILGESRCYYGNENVVAISDIPEVHCCLELVGDVAYLLQGVCSAKITLGAKEYCVDQNPFQYFDACEVDLECEGYILKIADQSYRCKYVPTYDVLVIKSDLGFVTTSDNRTIEGCYPIDTILEIDFAGNVVRVRDDVYIYHTKNPIPGCVSMKTIVKYMQSGSIVSDKSSPCVCEGVQDENRDAVNIVEKTDIDFDVAGSCFSDVLSYVSKPGYLFYPSDVKTFLRENNVFVRNGIVKGSLMASDIVAHIKYKEYKGSTIIDLICTMYTKRLDTDYIVNYFFTRHMNVTDSVLDEGATRFLHDLCERRSCIGRLKNACLFPYKDGYYVTSNTRRMFVNEMIFVDLNAMYKKSIKASWTRRLSDRFGDINLEYESYLLRRLNGIPRDSMIYYPTQLPSIPSVLGNYSIKIVHQNIVIYVNLLTGECVVGDKCYAALYMAFATSYTNDEEIIK